MKHNLKYITYLIFSLMICFNGQIAAQILYRKSPASAKEIKQVREALEADMNSLQKHRAFIFTMDIINLSAGARVSRVPIPNILVWC
jgi:hypothetical protein